MNQGTTRQFLPALMGSLRQDAQDGVLVLDQNDGTRHLYWVNGNLVYLKSEAAGEQFGNYLIRQGVLDWDALQELLAENKDSRFGDRLVKWGLLSEKERDQHLYNLMRQILLHALEHPIHEMKWTEAGIGGQLDLDLYFPLDYRRMVWETFQDLTNLTDVCELFRTSRNWRWEAQPDLLESLKDLPLTPQMAYALSFFGKDPVGFETMVSLTGMGEEETARLIVTLWSFNGLILAQGEMPSPASKRKVVHPVTPRLVPILKAPAPDAPPLPPVALTPPQASVALPPFEMPIPLTKASVIGLEHAPAHLKHLEYPESDAEESQPGTDPGTNPDADPGGVSTAETAGLTPTQHALRLFKKAKRLSLVDRTSEAVRMLEDAIKLDPEGIGAYDALMFLGRLRLANPAWSNRALESFQAASSLRPRAGEPFALMGELYRRKGFKIEAAVNYRKALELNQHIDVPAEMDLTVADVEPVEPKAPTLWARLNAWFNGPAKS